MRARRDAERVVRSWLEDGVTVLPDRVLDAVLDQVPATPQSRVWWPARKWASMNNAVRYGVAVAAVVAIASFGVGSVGPGFIIEGPPEAPNPTPAPSPMQLPAQEVELPAGKYVLGGAFPPGISFEVPEGWAYCAGDRFERGVCPSMSAGVSFVIVENLVADPCDPLRRSLDPPVGPSVDDLVTAISNLSGFDASEATDITLDGFRGKEIRLTAPATTPCELEDIGMFTWSTADRTNGVSAGEVNILRIVDVDGQRLMIATAYHPEQITIVGLDELQRVMRSVRIAPKPSG